MRNSVDAAASVADGAPVDWVSAESRADADNRRLVRHLRLVESIASLHRSIPAIEADDSHMESAAVADRFRAPGQAVGQWGRLSWLDRIGHGTSCEVYRAWDTALQREVALKLLHDEGDHAEAHGRILEEARRLARIRHAHVVQVYGAEHHDNRVGLWMELVRGESLEQVLQTRGRFGAREAALIGLDLCAALAAVHGAGLLHRDIKAQNVMRESGGRLVLMDFGTGEELSGTNRLVGTPLYLAPEIFAVSGPRSRATSTASAFCSSTWSRASFLSRPHRWRSWRGRTRTASVSRCETCDQTCRKPSSRRSNVRSTATRPAGITASASSSRRYATLWESLPPVPPFRRPLLFVAPGLALR